MFQTKSIGAWRIVSAAVVFPVLGCLQPAFATSEKVVQCRGTYVERVEGWTTNNWVFAPTVLYGGNRFRVIKESYPPVIRRADRDMPITMTDVYRLSVDGRPATVEFLAGDTSSPMFGWWNPAKKKGVLVLAEPFTAAGETGFTISEAPAEGVCTFTVSAPGFRRRRYKMCRFVSPSGDTPPKSTDTPFKVIRREFDANSVPEFLDTAFSVRKLMTGPTVPPKIEPFGYLVDLLLTSIDVRAWYEDDSIAYIMNWPPGPNRPTSHLQVGWCGSPPHAIAYLLRPTPERLRRVSRTFDALAASQGKSGFFFAMNVRGKLHGDCFGKIDQPERTMIRRQTASVMSGFDSLALMKQMGAPVKDRWIAAFRKTADALVRLWKREGELGQFVDANTGDIIVPNSANGALAPAALLSAADFTGDDDYLLVAEEMARTYRARFLERGFTCGGPVEAMQCPDSESVGELMVSFERLWEKTGKAEFLQAARMAAALASTWVNAYDYTFPEGTMFKREGVHSTGAVWASVQNRHGAPGHFHYCNGDILFRIWRATGDERVWELMADTARGTGQYVHTPSRPFFRPASREMPGSISERVNTGDWEDRDTVGMLTIPNDFNMIWVLTALSHMMEVPGVYVLMRDGQAETRSLDRVEARVEDGYLVISNNTAFDTTVSVMVETEEGRKKGLGLYPSRKWPVFPIAAGGVFRARLDDMHVRCGGGKVPAAYVTAPDAAHSASSRRHTGIPSVAVARNGRLWVTFYGSPTGGEDSNNYCTLATSTDGGDTWKDVLVVDPDGKGPLRAFDPEIWTAPDGRIFWTWTERVSPLQAESSFANAGCLADPRNDKLMCLEFPGDRELASPPPRPRQIGRGVMMCKPIVRNDGAWLFPSAHWNDAPSACIYESKDSGKTFFCIGGVTLPGKARVYDEHNVVQLRNGDLLTFIRTTCIANCMESVSHDGGHTWEVPKKARVNHTSCRLLLRKLKSGNLLLVKHGKIDEDCGRRNLTAYLSRDDGKTWEGGLLLDERDNASYPDGDQAADGLIHVVYDHDRLGAQEILLASFTEADVLAGKNASGRVRLRGVVSSGTKGLTVCPTRCR